MQCPMQEDCLTLDFCSFKKGSICRTVGVAFHRSSPGHAYATPPPFHPALGSESILGTAHSMLVQSEPAMRVTP